MSDHCLKRGVWAVTNGFPGTTILRIINSDGTQLMRVEVLPELADDRFVKNLETWLDKLDPVTKLQII